MPMTLFLLSVVIRMMKDVAWLVVGTLHEKSRLPPDLLNRRWLMTRLKDRGRIHNGDTGRDKENDGVPS